jgi:diaminopimelate epimerase
MHGLGNDYVYVNCLDEQVVDAPVLARAMSDRHRGVGSDGLILICPSEIADLRMEMYNADGSRAQMCGNGIRCVAKYAHEHGLFRSNPMRIETDGGTRDAEVKLEGDIVTAVRIDMGRPRFDPASLPCTLDGDRIVDRDLQIAGRSYQITCVSMGNPHVIVFVDDLAGVDLANAGSAIENHEVFPERTNAHFVKIVSPNEARMISWERGSGATQACGTGACAVGVAGVLTDRLQRRATLHLPG